MKTKEIKSIYDLSILVVDDEELIQRLIEKIFKLAGFHNIFAVSQGEKALALLGISDDGKNRSKPETTDIDLVIVDIVLSGISGFEVCRRIKGSGLDVPIILISGYEIADVHLNVLKSGADDFLTKPFTPVELLTRAKLLLERKEKSLSKIKYAEDLKKKFRFPYIGDQIDDYMITDFLGWGKSSFIYKTVDVSQGKIYALKIITKHALQFRECVKRFECEVEIMSKIRHPNIIQFENRGVYEDCPYVVMEFVDGINLEEYIITNGRIDVKSFYNVAVELASALLEIHNMEIIHRDIKLKNILYDIKTRKIKLSDFGIAKLFDSPDITHDGFVIGTPLYMSPEAFHGQGGTIRSDIYSYGVTMYHLATALPPFIGDSSEDLYEKHLKETPKPIHLIRPEMPAEWNALIVEKCLAKVPADRPGSMKEILNLLRHKFAFDKTPET